MIVLLYLVQFGCLAVVFSRDCKLWVCYWCEFGGPAVASLPAPVPLFLPANNWHCTGMNHDAPVLHAKMTHLLRPSPSQRRETQKQDHVVQVTSNTPIDMFCKGHKKCSMWASYAVKRCCWVGYYPAENILRYLKGILYKILVLCVFLPQILATCKAT